MKPNRYEILLVFCFTCLSVISTFKLEDAESSLIPEEEDLHEYKPRTLRIYSKFPESDKKDYGNWKKHINNVLSGGSIGLEMDMKKAGNLWDRVKKYLPGMRRFDDKGFRQGRRFGDNDSNEDKLEESDIEESIINPRVKPAHVFLEKERERQVNCDEDREC